ncbi:hybrid sensor histidine kinase/response regulator [Blastopirellula retiformator]|uniref:histidine kinase n=1 Tax=Blastopirellula retiformator TaxID=2527970 RepID=A0A5C5V7B9_9BACT|nr:hybrid sensor histidine kinase/response regulator [Blastopirellula retiformator]TWT34171.1 Phytochrome-like protein cph1 [Blastopirellula retiformator]
MNLNQSLQILLIDDSVGDAILLKSLLSKVLHQPPSIVHCTTAEAGLEHLKSKRIDCLFLDYMLDTETGLDVLKTIRDAENDVPVIIVTGRGCEEVAVDALSLGAQDYLVKGALSPHSVERALNNALQRVQMARLVAEQQREIRNFACVAAHDLRSPAGRVANYAELLLTDDDLTDEERTDFLETMKSSSLRMCDLIDRLLDYARYGRTDNEFGNVQLDDVWHHVQENLAFEMERAGARVEVDSLPQVFGEHTNLVQLLQNLVGNAIKYRGDRPPVVRLQATEGDHFWTISVADNGVGIPAEDVEEVFAPFRRSEAHTSFEGSGIGLATCRKIVELHGGKIWAESEPGVGTTLRFTLPASSEYGQTTQPDAAPASVTLT